MKKILSNFVLSVFVMGQILSLTVYADTSVKFKLNDLIISKIETSIETEKALESTDKNLIKSEKQLKLDEFKAEVQKPIAIEKPIISDDQVDVKVFECNEDSLPKNHEGVRKSQISYVTDVQKNVWRYVSWENFDEKNGHCEWTCNEKKGYTVNKEKNGCTLISVEKRKCLNEPTETEGMIKSSIGYFGYPNSSNIKELSWKYVSFDTYNNNTVKNVCIWTCDEEKGYKLSKNGKSCVLAGKEHDVTFDPKCEDVGIDIHKCFGSVTPVIDGGTYVLPKPSFTDVTYTLTYVDHFGTKTETRTAKLRGFYINDEYFQKCELADKCGEVTIYQPGDKVKITGDVTFYALWETEDLNVTVKSTSSYRKGSYRYDFVSWNKSGSNDSLKSGEILTLLKDTTLVANYNLVYVGGGNGGGNGGNSSNDDVILSGQVNGCSIVDSNYQDEWNEAFMYACENGITSIKDINEARLDEYMTRAEMAKFVAQFAMVTLKRTPTNINKDCSNFADSIKSYNQELRNYMTLACKFNYMGVHSSDYSALSDFMPNKTVSRAEFGTVLSRILWGDTYESNKGTYYTNHLNALKSNSIITNIDPNIIEYRGYVMLMLYRAAKAQGLIN